MSDTFAALRANYLIPADNQLKASGERLNADEYGLALAHAVAFRADCTRRKVGAVIIDESKRIVATGYNGAPAGKPGCLTAGGCPRGQKSYDEIPKNSEYSATKLPCPALHAEENALLHSARTDRSGSTIYITDPPCPNCSRLLAGSGLARAIWFDPELGQIVSRSL